MQNIEDYIKAHFRYEDGKIARDDRKNSNGTIDSQGYLILKIKGKQYKAHRIVWLLNYGEFPKNELDHINRIKTDNRIENLRESNRAEQNRNKDFAINKDTGCVGVYFDKTNGLKKNYALKYDGKTYRFYTLDEAKEFRISRGLIV